MTDLLDNNKIFESLQKRQSLNTTIIRIILSGLTILFFAFAPIGLNYSQSLLLMITAGIGFIGNIIASYFIYTNKNNVGILVSIFSFNFAYLGISTTYHNLGALTYLLIVVPTTILIFSYLSDNIKVPTFIASNIMGLLAVLFDFYLQNSNFRIYLNENILQLIYTLYLVLIVFISVVYLLNYLRLIKYFSIKSRMDSNQFIALTIGISTILLLVFFSNYNKAISINQDKLSSSISQISLNIENFYNNQTSAIQKTAQLPIFTNYIEEEFINNLTLEQQNNIESNLDLIKSETGLEGNNFVAAILDGKGELLAISDNDKRNFFVPENFYIDEMSQEPYVTDFQFSSNSNFSYIYFTHPIDNRYSSNNGVLVYAFNYVIFEKLINEISFFTNSNNYAIIMDNEKIQLYNGLNSTLAFSIPIENITQEKIDELIQNNKLPNNYNIDNYPSNTLFSNLIISADNQMVFDAISEGIDQEQEKYAGIESINILDNNFYITSLIPYSNIHSEINQSILFYFILGTILSAFYVLISQSNTLNISQGIHDLINSVNVFIQTNKIKNINYSNFDEITDLNNKLKLIEEKFSQIIKENEESLYFETSKLNKKILSLKNASSISIEISHLNNSSRQLHEAVELINQKFDFYHTCIFLYKDEYLQYFTGSGQEGYLLKESNYKLNVLADTPICEALKKDFTVAGSIYGKFLSHPILQDSQDELAIPIKVSNKTIGILNIHSFSENAFSSDEFFIFQNLANQLGAYYIKNEEISSLKIKNKELQFAVNLLNQENIAYSEKSKKNNRGYKYKLFEIEEIKSENEICRLAWEMKKVVISNQFQSLMNIYPNTVALPIFDNENVVNVISISFDTYEKLEETLPLLIKLTKEIETLLDKLRLIEQFNNANKKNQIVNSIVEDIFKSANLDDILINTTKSISEKFDLSEVGIQINPNANNELGEINE